MSSPTSRPSLKCIHSAISRSTRSLSIIFLHYSHLLSPPARHPTSPPTAVSNPPTPKQDRPSPSQQQRTVHPGRADRGDAFFCSLPQCRLTYRGRRAKHDGLEPENLSERRSDRLGSLGTRNLYKPTNGRQIKHFDTSSTVSPELLYLYTSGPSIPAENGAGITLS